MISIPRPFQARVEFTAGIMSYYCLVVCVFANVTQDCLTQSDCNIQLVQQCICFSEFALQLSLRKIENRMAEGGHLNMAKSSCLKHMQVCRKSLYSIYLVECCPLNAVTFLSFHDGLVSFLKYAYIVKVIDDIHLQDIDLKNHKWGHYFLCG